MAENALASIPVLTGVVTAAPAGATTTAEERAMNRSVATAAQTVNEANYLGRSRAVTFSVDHSTRLPVVTVVDTSTNEVVEQWPPAYLLQLAAEVKKTT